MATPAPTPSHTPNASTNLPLSILLALATLLNAYFFFLGTVCVRLWFYKGSLDPSPEKFLVLRKDLKNRYRESVFPGSEVTPTPAITTTTAIESPNAKKTPARTLDPDAFLPVAKISLHDLDAYEVIEDDHVQAYVAEELRISFLPPFEQDDCGDGLEFPSVVETCTPVEPDDPLSAALPHTAAHTVLGLQTRPMHEWLVLDNTYIPQLALRAGLLAERGAQCVQGTAEGKAACGELLEEVVGWLGEYHADVFRTKMKRMKRYIQNELTGEEFALAGVRPLEALAWLGVGDWCVWGMGEFTGEWYLQASATVFPAGWNMRKHIGKPLDLIINNMNEPMPMWEDLPTILSLPSLSPHTFTPTTLLTKTTLYIQTLPTPTSQPSLHIPRPVDFFPGALSNLLPSTLIIRTETTTFRRLPRTGAIAMNTHTRTKKLTDVVGGEEKKKLLDEVQGWEEDEARFKGRDLWITSLRGWCTGRPVFRDDRTVWSSVAPTVGGN
ncbi:hypothetical protein NX059_010171 [Plenodomus lindquistii]|nr:hypothetical protein NX059_010171 [Plenodomus lindquistii]